MTDCSSCKKIIKNNGNAIQCDIFPFHNISNTELLKLSFNSNTECQCSQRLMKLQLDSFPQLDILSSLDNIPHLTDSNIDSQLPCQTNFNYYSTHDFHSCADIKHSASGNSFSVLHSNIRSIAANFDKLYSMLDELQFPFSLIGLSETKIKINNDCLANTNLPGYNFLSQPTLSNAGGVGFFIKDDLRYSVREE